MENHNSRTVINRYLARRGARLTVLVFLACGWTAAWAQFNGTQTNGNMGGAQPSNGYGNSGYGGGYGGYGGYGNSGYGGGYGGYGGGGYGGSGMGSSGIGSSRFGQGSGSSRLGRNRSGSTSEDGSTSRYQSRRERSQNGSEQSGRRSSRKTRDDAKTGKAGVVGVAGQPGQPGPSTRSMGKTNVSQRKTTGAAKGGGGANAAPLPQVKYDPKFIEDALYFSPSFASVAPGDRFITTIVYYNSASHKVDEVDFWIKYNPQQVAPVWADTSKMKECKPGPVESQIWADQGYLHLAAKLSASPKGFTIEFADIHWRALTPTLSSRIELTGPAGKVTAVREVGKNLVEGKPLASSQKVSAEITITPLEWEDTGMRTADQVDDMMQPAPLGKAERLRLAIVSPTQEVATGAVATADVMLINPSGLAFDDLKLRIRFNPDEVAILDADHDNFIADGLNIYDGNFHQQFPFDGHIRNLVDLDHGVIDYQVGSVMGPRVFPNGVFARIVYRMKRNAGKAAFWFEAEDSLLHVRQTDVTAAGRSLLGDEAATAAEALHGFEVAVQPLDLKPLDRKIQKLGTVAQAQ